MTDTLRTRIIAALLSEEDVALMADAVIQELNLNTPVEYLSVDGTRRNFMVAGHYTVKEKEKGTVTDE